MVLVKFLQSVFV